MKKKTLAVLLAVSMTAGLAACGGGDSAPTADTGSGSAADDAADRDAAAAEDAMSDADTSEHVVITYMTTGDAPSGDALNTYNDMMEKLNAILTEKVNAELETYFISWTDYLANYNLTLAQMDGSVDLVGTSSDWLDSWPNAKNGAFLELSEEMLQTYAPQTWASVPADHWELCKYDGEIYLMPEDNYAQWTNHGYIYRMDWAKEAGLADGVHSWEDMTAYWKYCKEAFPDLIALWDSDGTSYNAMAGGWIASHSDYVSIDGINAGAMWAAGRMTFTRCIPLM